MEYGMSGINFLIPLDVKIECSSIIYVIIEPTPVFLPGESQGRGSLVGCRVWGHTESDVAEVT